MHQVDFEATVWVSKGKKVEASIAVSLVNSLEVTEGAFTYLLSNGELGFRLTTSYHGSEPSAELFEHIIDQSVSTINNFGLRFKLLSEGVIGIDEFFYLGKHIKRVSFLPRIKNRSFFKGKG